MLVSQWDGNKFMSKVNFKENYVENTGFVCVFDNGVKIYDSQCGLLKNVLALF